MASYSIALPNLASPTENVRLSDSMLFQLEKCRLGTMVVWLSQLKNHPRQREISHAWVQELFNTHFDEGRNLLKASYPLVVLAADDFKLHSAPDALPRAPEDLELLLISGQHRVAALKQIIQNQLEREGEEVGTQDILDDPKAEWPAIVYDQSLEAHSPVHFNIFMDSLNVSPPTLANNPRQLWASASAIFVTKGSEYANDYLRTVITGSSNLKAVVKAINHSQLRPAIDRLLKFPLFELVWSHMTIWTGYNCSTLWAGLLQEAAHALSRLTGGDETLQGKVTPQNIFPLSPQIYGRTYHKGDFMEVVEQLEDRVLWEEFAPQFATFEERWQTMVTRDLDYTSLLHSRGTKEAVLPWMWTKFLLSSPLSPLEAWVLGVKRILQSALLILLRDPPILHAQSDIYNIFCGESADEPYNAADVLHFAARYYADLTATLNRVWEVQDTDARALATTQLTRVTPSQFITRANKRVATVFEGLSYLVQMDPHWWTFAKILVADRFQEKTHRFSSGIIVYEDGPDVFLREETKALELKDRAIEESKKAAKTARQVAGVEKDLERVVSSVARMQVVVELRTRKVAGLKRSQAVAEANGEELKGESIQRLKNISDGLVPMTNIRTSDLDTQTAGPSSLPLPALPPRSLIPLVEHSGIAGIGSEEKEAAHAIVQLQAVRNLVGSHRIAAFEEFLEKALQEDALSKIGDGQIDLDTAGSKGKGKSVVRGKKSAGKGKGVNHKRSKVEEDDEDKGFGGQPSKKRRQS
ncbi:hypothetical protein BS47DRAFT_1343447 [Hydnum rufescens UP504]|uniref:Uncharacterized protein n=1 Tax=Hydnum rufescens UP504 TaxID=1448309 RepID=A0A9P6AY27_9AGAM|nr:hypothetical protein BS47DRAFT_1343447 [Hydnum rufescens UP504]